MPIRMAPSRLGAASSARLAKPEHDRSGKPVDPFYASPEWKSFRSALITERGWRCEDPQCATPYGPWKQIYADHVIELSDGGAPFDRANALLRCGVCHARKTRDEKLKRIGFFDPAKLTRG